MVSIRRLCVTMTPWLVGLTIIFFVLDDNLPNSIQHRAHTSDNQVTELYLSRAPQVNVISTSRLTDPNTVTVPNHSMSARSSQGVQGTKYPVIFYNRVPKCGSSGLIDVISHMSVKNNFTFVRSTLYMHFWLTDIEEEHLVNNIESMPRPLIFERHVHYVDFEKYMTDVRPIYVNVIREPIDRLASWYYYRRYQKGHIRKMPLSDRIRSYDECVLGNYSECTSPKGNRAEEGYFKIIPFFCGQEDFCSYPTERALYRAISNVKHKYLVVGTTPYLQQFIELLEDKLPQYFSGASFFYRNTESALKEKFQTKYKLPVSNEVVRIMKPKLKLEYQFYYFVRNHFKKQYEELYNTTLHWIE